MEMTSQNICRCSGWQHDPDHCMPYVGWCHPSLPTSCPAELGSTPANNAALCSSYQLWASRTCDYTVYGAGHRCRGRMPGQCVYPHSEHGDPVRYCEDKSMQVHSENTTCPGYTIEQSTHCSARIKKWCRVGARSYNSYYHYWRWCLSCYDPGNCTGSCAPPPTTPSYSLSTHPHCALVCQQNTRGYNLEQCQACTRHITPGCTACANPSYFGCPKSHQCVHMDLRCDQTPQCTHGEDEEGCEEKYKEKEFTPPEALWCGMGWAPPYHFNATQYILKTLYHV